MDVVIKNLNNHPNPNKLKRNLKIVVVLKIQVAEENTDLERLIENLRLIVKKSVKINLSAEQE